MKKIKALITIYNRVNDIYNREPVNGYELEAWNSKMIVHKNDLGLWQVSDIRTGFKVSHEFDTRKKAIEELKKTQQDINQETYNQCVNYWLLKMGWIKESKQSISFAMNKARSSYYQNK